jgi:hypothetical protein
LAGGSGTLTTGAGTCAGTPRMASCPVIEGGSYRVRHTLEGDIWSLERPEDGNRVEREVCRRVPATP